MMLSPYRRGKLESYLRSPRSRNEQGELMEYFIWRKTRSTYHLPHSDWRTYQKEHRHSHSCMLFKMALSSSDIATEINALAFCLFLLPMSMKHIAVSDKWLTIFFIILCSFSECVPNEHNTINSKQQTKFYFPIQLPLPWRIFSWDASALNVSLDCLTRFHIHVTLNR